MPNQNKSSPDRQRQLTRVYKETQKNMGVYKIHNTATNQSLVASSRDVDARINRHRFELKMNSDRTDSALQAQWNQHGSDAFEFTILDVLEPLTDPNAEYDPTEDLAELEAMCIQALPSYTPFS